MINYLKELKKFNVTYVELSHSNFNKDNKDCIFYDEIKELILKQDDDIEKKYFLTNKNVQNFLSQIVYSNKNNTVIYRPQIHTVSIFDNNFELLFEFHSDPDNYNNNYIAGTYWRNDKPAFDKLQFVFPNSNNDFFYLKPHDRNKNQIGCQSSSNINKICLFIFKEDSIQVNFHLSVIKNIIFNLDGSINSINLLDRVSEETYLGPRAYNDIIKKFENNVEFKDLCEKTTFTMMSEDVFNKNIGFIYNIIHLPRTLDITKIHKKVDKIIEHFEKLEIMTPIKTISSYFTNKSIDYSKLLKDTPYYPYVLIEDKRNNIKRQTLLFLALMKIKDINIDSILNFYVLNEIRFINDTAKTIAKTGLDTLIPITKIKKRISSS